MNNIYPECLEELISSFRRLPGIGLRTAERLAMNVVGWTEEECHTFAMQLDNLKQNLKFCQVCGNFSEGERCPVCLDVTRNGKNICVVEQAPQIAVLEQSGVFRGLYHVLGGKLRPLDGVGPEVLRINELIQRVELGGIEEVIIALSFDVEGEATSSYLVEELRQYDVKVSRLASGLPVGGDISFADSGTLNAALNRRYEIR